MDDLTLQTNLTMSTKSEQMPADVQRSFCMAWRPTDIKNGFETSKEVEIHFFVFASLSCNSFVLADQTLLWYYFHLFCGLLFASSLWCIVFCLGCCSDVHVFLLCLFDVSPCTIRFGQFFPWLLLSFLLWCMRFVAAPFCCFLVKKANQHQHHQQRQWQEPCLNI